jgi:hypothetical protein
MSKQATQIPPRAFPLTTYAELDRVAASFALGRFAFLILLGKPGLGESRAVARAIGPGALWARGNTSAAGLYRALWEHRDLPVVIDDLDAIDQDPRSIRLLKGLCETEAKKTVVWETEAAFLASEGIPRSFTTTSRVCIVTNEWRGRTPNALAVEDRGTMMAFTPPPLEAHLYTAAWFWDQEIHDWIGANLALAGDHLSLRQYLRAWELKTAEMNWREMLLREWGVDATTIAVARIAADPAYQREDDRVRAFVARGHGSRSTYYERKKKLSPFVESEVMPLHTHAPALPDWETALEVE